MILRVKGYTFWIKGQQIIEEHCKEHYN